MPPHIIIYTKENCPYCDRAKRLLTAKGYVFEEVDLTDDPEGQLALVEKAGGQKTVPQIFIDGSHIGGCEDLERLAKDGILFSF